jgi:hypothetical protein
MLMTTETASQGAGEAKTPKAPEMPDAADADARLFYQVLEQNGQLVNVDADADLTSLPANVTHVRYPDGRVERVGFSASGYLPR